jgi:hypothetical protein
LDPSDHGPKPISSHKNFHSTSPIAVAAVDVVDVAAIVIEREIV